MSISFPTDPQHAWRVMVESPFANKGALGVRYLYACLRDCLNRGEAPFASHGFYTQFLNDTIPTHRELGIACGYRWGMVADLIVFYTDLGWSHGMIEAQTVYKYVDQIERKLPPDILDRVLTDTMED